MRQLLQEPDVLQKHRAAWACSDDIVVVDHGRARDRRELAALRVGAVLTIGAVFHGGSFLAGQCVQRRRGPQLIALLTAGRSGDKVTGPGGENLAKMRVEYGAVEKDGSPDLDADWLADGWVSLLRAWLADAEAAGVAEPNAMVVGTVDGKG